MLSIAMGEGTTRQRAWHMCTFLSSMQKNIAAEQLVNVLSSGVREDSVLCINTYHVSCKDPSPRALLQL